MKQEYIHVTRHLQLCLLLCASIFQNYSAAEEVVRFNFSINGSTQSIDVTLYDEITPVTVSNFLNYVNRNDYNRSFLHRIEPGFIIQGGGYTYDATLGSFVYDPATNSYNGGLQPVPTDAPIPNEFKFSNSRGTLAMAKLPATYETPTGTPCFVESPPDCTLVPGTGEDSATNQWFFNLSENSLALDNQNGGFTVFGKVLGNGMLVIDQLAQVTTVNAQAAHPEFSNLPLNNAESITAPENINESNLIMVDSINRLFSIDTYINFGSPSPGQTITRSLSINNLGDQALSIGNIDVTALDASFTVNTSDCLNSTLATNSSCTMTASLTPTDNTPRTDTFTINLDSPAYTFVVTLTTYAPDIRLSLQEINFGDQQTYIPGVTTRTEQLILFITNIGTTDLTISDVTLTGQNADDYVFTDNCSSRYRTPSQLAPGDFCLIPINFQAQNSGLISAQLNILSDDPDESLISVPVISISNPDLDGVSASIEDNAPNNGDGNNDGIKDSLQSNVISLTDLSGSYFTFVTDSAFTFDNVSVIEMSTLASLPPDIDASTNLFTFDLSEIPDNFTAGIGIILPNNTLLEDIIAYAATDDDNTEHWFSLKDKLVVLNNVSMTNGDKTITRNVATLRLRDGENGDADKSINKVLKYKFALNLQPIAPESSGARLSPILIIIIYIIRILLRRAPKNK